MTESNVVSILPQLLARSAGRPLRRPALLIRAARAGQAAWRHERDLPRLMRGAAGQGPGGPLGWLLAEEARADQARRDSAADYDLTRHVTLLIALLHEMTLAAMPPPLAMPAQQARPAAPRG